MIVSRAVELNEQLDTVLKRHDALLAAKPTGISTHANYEQSEEEEAEQLFRRYAIRCRGTHRQSYVVEHDMLPLICHCCMVMEFDPLIAKFCFVNKKIMVFM